MHSKYVIKTTVKIGIYLVRVLFKTLLNNKFRSIQIIKLLLSSSEKYVLLVIFI